MYMYVYVYMYIQQNVTVIVIGLSFPTLAGSPFRFALILGLVNHVRKMAVKTKTSDKEQDKEIAFLLPGSEDSNRFHLIENHEKFNSCNSINPRRTSFTRFTRCVTPSNVNPPTNVKRPQT